MMRIGKTSLAIALALALALAGFASAASARSAASAAKPAYTVVAPNLDNPRGMSFGPDGSLYVAEAGRGGHGRCSVDPGTGSKQCIGPTGAILRIKGSTRQRVVTGLPSVADGTGGQATGPADVIVKGGRLVIVMQDATIDTAGNNPFGPAGTLLGRLVQQPLGGGARVVGPDFAKFEAAHNPDNGAGAAQGGAIDSDPYSVAAYRGGYAVADAAGNDLLFVDPHGKVSVLAVFGTQLETAPPGSAGPGPTQLAAQSVPTSVVAGPDGALYVGELTGFPFNPGAARIWRIVPGHKPTLFARGLTNISSLAFDRQGRLLALEIDTAGLLDNAKTSGAVIRLDGRTRKSRVLLAQGLRAATGIAVGPDGSIFVSIFGSTAGTGPGLHGRVVRLNAR